MTIHRTAKMSYDDAFAEVERLRGPKKIERKVKHSFDKWATSEFGKKEGEERAEAFHDLIQNWADLANRRHNVIHCCWSTGIEDEKITGTRKGKPLTIDGRPFKIKDVENLGNNLKQFVFRLNKATRPSWVSGPAKEIAAMPAKFSQNYIMPQCVETTATTAIFTESESPK